MFLNQFRAKSKFIIDLKTNTTIPEKEVELFKDENDLFFKCKIPIV